MCVLTQQRNNRICPHFRGNRSYKFLEQSGDTHQEQFLQNSTVKKSAKKSVEKGRERKHEVLLPARLPASIRDRSVTPPRPC